MEVLLAETAEAGAEDRDTINQATDAVDPSEGIAAQLGADAVAEGLRERLAAIERAEARLREGTYGRSVRSGLPIPDERLEADPAAELTLDEARGRPPIAP